MKHRHIFRLHASISKQSYTIITILVFVVLLALWQIFAMSGLVKELFLPSPVKVFQYIVGAINDGSMRSDMAISVYRIVMGFLLAAVLAIPLGILAGCLSWMEALISPLCEFVRYMPVPAFVPLVMIWCGIGESAKIVIIFLGTFFQMVLMVADDARSVSEDLLASSYTLGASSGRAILTVLIPAMLPRMMDTVRMMIGWAWTYLVVAELIAANSGLGYSILKAQRFVKTEAIYGGIIVIGLLGLITDRVLVLINRRLFHWAESR